MNHEEAKKQLGMNPSTASHRLLKDILWSFIARTNFLCYHCAGRMTREDFSIEHKKPWLGTENPREMYFDLDNISFSHQKCNYAAARRPHKKYFTAEEKRLADNRNQANYKKRKRDK